MLYFAKLWKLSRLQQTHSPMLDSLHSYVLYSQTAKNDHCCTNRHMSTQSPPNTQTRANAATSRDLHHMCLGSGHSPSPVGRADSVCLHGRPCVWFPFAAACFYTLFYQLMMPAARLVCQRPSSNFPYFRTHSQTFCSPARTP